MWGGTDPEGHGEGVRCGRAQSLQDNIIPRLPRLALALLAALILTACAVAAPAGTAALWFDDLAASPPIAEQEAAAIAGYAAAAVRGEAPAEGDLPALWRTYTAPRMVFISVSDGQAAAAVVRGAGAGIAEATAQAIEQARALVGAGRDPVWIKVDIVAEVYAQPAALLDAPQPYERERSLFGLAFDEASGLAFLPEEVLVRTLLNSDQELKLDNIEAYLAALDQPTDALERIISAGQADLYRFSTLSFFSDGGDLLRLYRGHRLFEGDLAPADLLGAAEAGGRYLARSVNADGSFVYSYFAKTDEVPDDYNLVRHAGTLYAMLELYGVTGDPALLEAAQRAIGYMNDRTLPCEAHGVDALCPVEGGEVKLGGNALAIVALAEYTRQTGDEQYLPLMRDLARWIVSVQAADGEFTIHQQVYSTGEAQTFTSEYYPGEALLALLRLYALDPDEAWLDAAARGATWLITVRDGELTDAQLSHDHWLLYALNELYRYRPDALYYDHAMRIAGAIVASQHLDPPYPDWAGGYYTPPRSTPAATRGEGLSAAYQLARDFGTPQQAQPILEAMQRGAAFTLRTQFYPETAMYLADPPRALGGFHTSLTDYEIRIDYVQHAISSLLGLYRALGGG